MSAASDLRPGHTITRDDIAVTVIKIVPLGCGEIEIIWGGGGEDRCVLPRNAEVDRVDA